jgi:hypothetical protein
MHTVMVKLLYTLRSGILTNQNDSTSNMSLKGQGTK